MARVDEFVAAIKESFPDDRLTYQKAVPTFHPESADEAAGLCKLANQLKQKLFITGFGNNIDPQGEPFVNMVSIRTDRLNQLQEVQKEDFYIKAGAGYPLREVNLVIERDGLWLPHAHLPYVGSVGGAIASGLSADYDGHDYPLKKFLVQAEIVTPTGDVITPGSPSFKSVSGYDIVKLFAGSWGLLGLVVSATFRIMPLSGRDDYGNIRQKAIDRSPVLAAMAEDNDHPDAVYSRKIKRKFDPAGILPLV